MLRQVPAPREKCKLILLPPKCPASHTPLSEPEGPEARASQSFSQGPESPV